MISGPASAPRPRRRKKAPPPPAGARDYRAIVEAWEEGILSGAIDHGSLPVAAVRRQRRDLANPPEGYRFDEAVATKSCALAEELAFPKGRKRGERFILEPWEVFFVWCIFGWVDAATGLPRFHKVTLFIPKGNGKSPLAAAIGIIVLARGEAVGAKVFAAAVSEEQANNVFEPAQEMLRLSPELREAAGLVVEQHAIKGLGDARSFKRISAEKRSADGKVGDCFLVDEVHQHPNRNLYDVLANNASKVEGSRLVVISTGGTDPSETSIGWILYGEAKQILLGEVTAPAHFVLIFEAERESAPGVPADPWSEKTWRQANPNFGVSISIPNFRTIADAARIDPTAQPHFFATRLGWWTRAAAKWMAEGLWAGAAVKIADEHFLGRKVFDGIDYAPEKDLSAKAQVGADLGPDGRRRYFARFRVFLPKLSPTIPDLEKLLGEGVLASWIAGGWLELVDPPPEAPASRVIDAGFLRPLIVEDAQKLGAEVCLDPFGCVELMASLPREGIQPVRIFQKAEYQSPAMTEIQVALQQGRFFHDGSPLVAWCMGNVLGAVDRKGQVTPARESELKKIDPVAALINAMYRALTADLTPPPVDDGDPIRFIDFDDD